MWIAFMSFPSMAADDYAKVRFPRNVDDLRDLYSVLSRYRDLNYWAVLSGFASAYILYAAAAASAARPRAASLTPHTRARSTRPAQPADVRHPGRNLP